MKNIRKDSVTARLSGVFTLAMAVALLATLSAQAGFIAPQTFDFGDGSGKYQHDTSTNNWRESGSPNTSYSTDALNIAPPSDGSGSVFASFDSPKNGADFELTHDWDMVSSATNARVGLNAFAGVAGGSEQGGGYNLGVEYSAGTPYLKIYRDAWSTAKDTTEITGDDPLSTGTGLVRMKLIGDYASDGSSIDLTGEYYEWDSNNSQWTNKHTVSYSDGSPFTGSEYSIGAYKLGSIDADQFSVVPEPSTLALLGLAGLLLMRRRRRV